MQTEAQVHWSLDVWLLVFTNEHPTVNSLRDEIKAVAGSGECMVVKASGPEWAGFVFEDKRKTWEDWFNEYWK